MSAGYGTLDSDFSSDFGGTLKIFFNVDYINYAKSNKALLDALAVSGKQIDKWIDLASRGKSVLGFSSGSRQDARRKKVIMIGSCLI